MDICQHCFYLSKIYFYIGTYTTHLRRDHTEWIVYWSSEQLQDGGFAIKYDNVLLPFILEPHRNPCLHHSDNNSSD